jgi:hypothetical protein
MIAAAYRSAGQTVPLADPAEPGAVSG